MRNLILLLLGVALVGCSKKKIDPLGSSGMSMKVNGVEWKATMSTLFTENPDESVHLVYINGTKVFTEGGASGGEHVESLGMYINIPASKFRNPKGVYPVILDETNIGHSWALFSSNEGFQEGSIYVSGDPENPNSVVGQVEITGFDIGMQSVFGQATGKEGYTKLSGKFQMTLHTMIGDKAPLKITDGKFDLNHTINLGL